MNPSFTKTTGIPTFKDTGVCSNNETARYCHTGKKFGFAAAGLLGVCALILGSTPAIAATATTTFGVSATVVATCGVTATAMPFGNYTGVLINVTSAVSVTCTNTTTYNLGLSAGLATGATVSNRSMTGGAVLLNYALYRDSSRTLNWGVTIGTDTLAGTGNGSVQPLTVYGQLPAGQFVTPGAYADTITATVTY